MTFKRPRPQRRSRVVPTAVAMLVVAGVAFAGLKYLGDPSTPNADPEAQARTDAATAVDALRANNLTALEQQLATNRGGRDFAYFFASQVTPRDLGDALSSVAGDGPDEPLKADMDAHAYDLELADLAGTLALATHGVGDRALPTSWTDHFVTATTTPAALHRTTYGPPTPETQQRADQDLANKQNLLLLLARGYWSTPFLETVTAAFWQLDQDLGEGAWPTTQLEDADYAPAPNGTYLTDGVLALTAALTANPEASAWAFTDFQPGTATITFDDTDHSVGRFSRFLFFEHTFPGGSGDSVGMTASLTALSAAIDAAGVGDNSATDEGSGPQADSLVLQAMAKSSRNDNDCSWNPIDYGHCAKAVLDTVMHWVDDWGHTALDILSLATFAPPPFDAVGVGAAATNATWYAIDGDYANAGLSLAAAVPGLAFAKLAKEAKAAVAVEKAAAGADDVAKAASEIRAAVGTESSVSRIVTADDVATRPSLLATTRAEVIGDAPKTVDGDFIDPNTGAVIPFDGPFDFGHKPGYEWRCTKARAVADGWTMEYLLGYFNNPAHYQIEDPSANRSHRYEASVCALQ